MLLFLGRFEPASLLLTLRILLCLRPESILPGLSAARAAASAALTNSSGQCHPAAPSLQHAATTHTDVSTPTTNDINSLTATTVGNLSNIRRSKPQQPSRTTGRDLLQSENNVTGKEQWETTGRTGNGGKDLKKQEQPVISVIAPPISPRSKLEQLVGPLIDRRAAAHAGDNNRNNSNSNNKSEAKKNERPAASQQPIMINLSTN